jgi:hypothetical protein
MSGNPRYTRRRTVLTLGAAMAAVAPMASAAPRLGRIIQVGPTRSVRTISEAARLALSGDTVEIDAAEYVQDVAVWRQNELYLRAVGGQAILTSQGVSAEDKAIWIMRCKKATVEGFRFTGATVPDRNGAGIRLEDGSLTLRNCQFIGNENGILTNNDPLISLTIVDSEFGHNGHGDGQSHNLYAGAIGTLSVSGSYFHHAVAGHLLKSRAAVNDIRYNRFADGADGRASYELEFANGGVAYVIGNIIEQAAQTENRHMLAFGMEGYASALNALFLIHNTMIDHKPLGGRFLRVRPGIQTLLAMNNLLIGSGLDQQPWPSSGHGNTFMPLKAFDRLRGTGDATNTPVAAPGGLAKPGSAYGVSLQPTAQYRSPMGQSALNARPHNPGAIQTAETHQRR